MKVTKPVRRWLRMTALLAALVGVLTVAAPAWAGTVQIQDDARVLNVTTVQIDAATLPVGVYIWTTTQDAASKPTFDADVRNKSTATFPVVVGVNTQARHESIQIGPRAGLSQSAAVSARPYPAPALPIPAGHPRVRPRLRPLFAVSHPRCGHSRSGWSGRRGPAEVRASCCRSATAGPVDARAHPRAATGGSLPKSE